MISFLDKLEQLKDDDTKNWLVEQFKKAVDNVLDTETQCENDNIYTCI